ncbi:MAG: tRNA threonylcarbamoyladenosine dehydratase [Planctomycetaceae bacterium]|nr:tRNA threonylcarbamoyladenosine dehydratase [Planctomycetaceae bacterium]
MDSQFQRLEQMIGEPGLQRLQEAFVVVVGLGAVGSYAVEALARSGVGRLRLIDFDEVRPSNINRQLYALWETVGRKKCALAVERVTAINPQCKVEALDLFVHADTTSKVLAPAATGRQPDFVLDAIDSLNPKLELVTALSASGLPFLSSMGAALRTDPTLVRIGSLREVTHCPLAAILRKYLRRRNVSTDFDCVYSPEPVRHLRRDAVLSPEMSEENFYPQGRKRASLGSLPTLTGIFGLTAANHILLKLLGDFVAL